MSNAFIPKHKGEKEPREKILKLGKKITDCLPHKLHGLTTDDPEYWGLACVVTDEMADIALKMKVRKHYTFEQLLKMNKGYTSTELQKILDEMSHIGILEYDYGDLYDKNGPIEGKRERRYLLPLFVPGSAEFTNMIKEKRKQDYLFTTKPVKSLCKKLFNSCGVIRTLKCPSFTKDIFPVSSLTTMI